jgi:hypothetical protein
VDCPTRGGPECDASSSHIGAALDARNIGCLHVGLNERETIDDPLPPDHRTPALGGRDESNTDLDHDSDYYDAGEQRAFRQRVFITASVSAP